MWPINFRPNRLRVGFSFSPYAPVDKILMMQNQIRNSRLMTSRWLTDQDHDNSPNRLQHWIFIWIIRYDSLYEGYLRRSWSVDQFKWICGHVKMPEPECHNGMPEPKKQSRKNGCEIVINRFVLDNSRKTQKQNLTAK